MLAKRYRLKLATWTVVREPGQPSPAAAKPGGWRPRLYLRRIPRP